MLTSWRVFVLTCSFQGPRCYKFDCFFQGVRQGQGGGGGGGGGIGKGVEDILRVVKLTKESQV